MKSAEWFESAACLGIPRAADIFYPVGTTGMAEDQIAIAKSICAGCPVQLDCLEWALAHDEQGVWGGMSEDDRRRLRRRLRREAVRVAEGGPEQLTILPPVIDPGELI